MVNSSTYYEIAIDVKGTGWVGFGLGASMDNADIVYGYYSSQGVPVLSNCYAREHAQPLPKGANCTITTIVGKYSGGITRLAYRRDFALSGPYETAVTKGNNNIIVSRNSGSQDLSSKHTDRTEAVINFFAGTTTIPPNYPLMHGILMFLAWGLFVVGAMFIARYFKSLGKPWFWIHIGSNVLAFVMIIVAFVLIVVYALNSFTTDVGPVAIIHAWVGITVIFAGVVAQPLLGWYADYKWEPDRDSTPVFPDIVHHWTGRLSLFFAFFNMYLGLSNIGAEAYWYVLLSIWILGILILFTVFFFINRSKENKNVEMH